MAPRHSGGAQWRPSKAAQADRQRARGWSYREYLEFLDSVIELHQHRISNLLGQLRCRDLSAEKRASLRQGLREVRAWQKEAQKRKQKALNRFGKQHGAQI